MSEVPVIDEYKFGFHDDVESIVEIGGEKDGLNEQIIRDISAQKKEPQWMLDFRLQSYDRYKKSHLPSWGPDLSELDLDDLTFYKKKTRETSRTWDDVPDDIKETFERIGIPQAERESLAGVIAQYESEAVYQNTKSIYEDQGVIFMDTDSALREHPELFKKYFGKLVPASDNFEAALNSALWSGGTFIYVPKGVKVDIPLQTYFRMNDERMGQFERTLIVVDEGASVEYIEGCTAPSYTESSLHAAIVEIFVEEGGYCRYSTIQNWSSNVWNLVTKRAHVGRNATMEWIDGNLGSRTTMKYP